MKKLWLLIVLVAFLAMLYAPAVVAAPPGSDDDGLLVTSGTDGSDPGGTIDPPPEPPDADPWSPGGKMIAPADNDDKIQTESWIIIEIWSLRLIWVR